jgi:hypothetical protein
VSDDPYFGYTTSGNKELMDARRMAARMREDIRHYPPPTSSAASPDFTVDYDSSRVKELPYDQQTQLATNDTIERIYKRIMAQDAGAIYKLSDQWMRVVQVIEDLAGRVLKTTNGLKYGGDGTSSSGKGWTGKGADAFLARGPGATLKSLDDWKSAAFVNWSGTFALAEAIIRHQFTMAELWDQYRKTMVNLSQEWLKSKGELSVADIKDTAYGDEYVTYLRTISGIWSLKAQKIQAAMAKDYWSVMNEDLGGGRATVYEGPTDAVQPNPAFIARWQMKQFPVPSVSRPNVNKPNINKPNVNKPNVTPPKVTPPKIQTPPHVTRPVVTPKPKTLTVTAPTKTTPSVTQQVVVPPMVPVLPVAPGVGQPSDVRTPSVKPATPPAVPDANRLGNPSPGGGPGVLRGAASAAQSAQGLPPSLPQSPAKGQAHPPPQIKGRGPGAPGAPQGQRGESNPQTPATPVAPGTSDQFGGPSGNPSAPVLRSPASTTPPTKAAGPRRGGPAGQPGGEAPLRPGAAPPVLNRPRPAGPEAGPPVRQSVRPSAHGGPLAASTPHTTSPVVGRTAHPGAGQPQPPEQSSGVVRGTRRAGSSGYEAQIGSRTMGQDEQLSIVDQEFEKIRKLLDKEDAWTVETPGGGVLDSTQTRAVTPATEPKPTLSA